MPAIEKGYEEMVRGARAKHLEDMAYAFRLNLRGKERTEVSPDNNQ